MKVDPVGREEFAHCRWEPAVSVANCNPNILYYQEPTVSVANFNPKQLQNIFITNINIYFELFGGLKILPDHRQPKAHLNEGRSGWTGLFDTFFCVYSYRYIASTRQKTVP
jgi:hypothetical protein